MVREFIVTLYKVMYNKQLKRGVENNPRITSALVTALFIFILGLNCFAVYEILFRKMLKISQGKIGNFIMFGIFSYFVYLLIFKIYNVDSEKITQDGYELNEGTSKKIWILFIANFALVFILPLFRDYYFTRLRL